MNKKWEIAIPYKPPDGGLQGNMKAFAEQISFQIDGNTQCVFVTFDQEIEDFLISSPSFIQTSRRDPANTICIVNNLPAAKLKEEHSKRTKFEKEKAMHPSIKEEVAKRGDMEHGIFEHCLRRKYEVETKRDNPMKTWVHPDNLWIREDQSIKSCDIDQTTIDAIKSDVFKKVNTFLRSLGRDKLPRGFFNNVHLLEVIECFLLTHVEFCESKGLGKTLYEMGDAFANVLNLFPVEGTNFLYANIQDGYRSQAASSFINYVRGNVQPLDAIKREQSICKEKIDAEQLLYSIFIEEEYESIANEKIALEKVRQEEIRLAMESLTIQKNVSEDHKRTKVDLVEEQSNAKAVDCNTLGDLIDHQVKIQRLRKSSEEAARRAELECQILLEPEPPDPIFHSSLFKRLNTKTDRLLRTVENLLEFETRKDDFVYDDFIVRMYTRGRTVDYIGYDMSIVGHKNRHRSNARENNSDSKKPDKGKIIPFVNNTL